jgi:hypothetical protein
MIGQVCRHRLSRRDLLQPILVVKAAKHGRGEAAFGNRLTLKLDSPA